LLLSFVLWAPDASAEAEAEAEADAEAEPEAEPDAKMRVLVLDLEVGNADEHVVQALTRAVVDAISQRAELQVFAAEDLRQIVELEAEKAALGCDTSSCLAEVAGAMGARFVVFGGVTRVEDDLVLSLTVFDAEEAKPVNRKSYTHSSASRQLRYAPVLVDELLAPLGFAPIAEVAPDEEPASEGGGLGPVLLWSGVGVGALGAVGAAVGLGVASWATLTLSDRTGSSTDKTTALSLGAPMLIVGGVGALVAVGGGALAGVGAMSGGE
jgi:TolB-like protein